jgi:cell wall-associated NlpC family hydrolase
MEVSIGGSSRLDDNSTTGKQMVLPRTQFDCSGTTSTLLRRWGISGTAPRFAKTSHYRREEQSQWIKLVAALL